MPKTAHTEAATQHDLASKSHHAAIAHFDKGDHTASIKSAEEAVMSSNKAQGLSTNAQAKSKSAK